MRIISGCCRGLRLVSPAGEDTRPTLDRVKEAVFSMLMPNIPGADVLDLFAGSGALGLEALSRGAERAVFVDNSAEAISCIKKNVSSAHMESRAAVKNASAVNFAEECNDSFDIIFLDPPYSGGLYRAALEAVSENGLLKSGGVVVCEWDSRIGKPEISQRFNEVKEKKYGRVCITVLETAAQD